MSDSSDDLFSDSDWELGISGLISQTHGNSDSVLPEDNVIEQQVQFYLSNTVPPGTLRSNTYALNVFHKFAVTDKTIPDHWEQIELSRITYALIRFVAVRGKHYRASTF